MYADDGLIFPETGEEDPEMEDLPRGIEQNREKSG